MNKIMWLMQIESRGPLDLQRIALKKLQNAYGKDDQNLRIVLNVLRFGYHATSENDVDEKIKKLLKIAKQTGLMFEVYITKYTPNKETGKYLGKELEYNRIRIDQNSVINISL